MNPKRFLTALFLFTIFYSISTLGQNLQKHFKPLPIPIKAASSQFESTAPFVFIDGRGKPWTAPVGTVTDGASIPQICMSFIGPPMADERRAAALVHDAYCAKANEGKESYHQATWQDVHKMFYEALLAGGTSDVDAKIMYAAVWMFGPRDWTYVPKQKYFVGLLGKHKQKMARKMENLETILQKDEIKALDVTAVAEAEKLKQMEELVNFIKVSNPDVSQLDKTMTTVSMELKKNNKAIPVQ